MTEIVAPAPLPERGPFVFLAGSIEMGAADNWQQRVALALDGQLIVLNPRRDDWDSSWVQSKDNPQFRAQVEWELAALDRADVVLMYFDPATHSPISLLELGLYHNKMVVCCPEGFWRKGNVDIVCEWFGIEQASDIEALVSAAIRWLPSFSLSGANK